MNDHEFSEWRRPSTQAALFPKAWQYNRAQKRLATEFTCQSCGNVRDYRDIDPWLDFVCIGCAQTLF